MLNCPDGADAAAVAAAAPVAAPVAGPPAVEDPPLPLQPARPATATSPSPPARTCHQRLSAISHPHVINVLKSHDFKK
jgi:hypothetical protein